MRSPGEFRDSTGKVRHFASEGRPGTVADYLYCTDTIEVDVTVTLRTEDGALDERAPGVLYILSSDEAELTIKLDGNALNGTWALDTDPSAEVEATVNATYAQDLLLGTISVVETRSLGNGIGVAGGSARSSYFGSGRCVAGQAEVSLDAESYGFSAGDVLALLNDHEPIALTWKNGEATAVAISVPEPPEYACRTVREDWCPAGSMNMTAGVKLTSEDGRLGSKSDAQLTGVKKADADGLATVRVLFRLDAIPAASFEEQTSLSGVDLDGFESAALELIGWYDATTEPATPSGTLTVQAQGPCNDDPGVCEDLFETVEEGKLGSGPD